MLTASCASTPAIARPAAQTVGDDRVSDWLVRKGITRDHPILTDSGPKTDALNLFPPISSREERFYYDEVIHYRKPRTAAPQGNPASQRRLSSRPADDAADGIPLPDGVLQLGDSDISSSGHRGRDRVDPS
jgi:hypothetical protein